MSDDRSISIDVGLGAKVEVTTEVPASSAGRLVDALTDLIRPFSEARGLRADQIRLQREDVLIQVALKARERLRVEEDHPHPIPNKVLVPLLEKASLEEIDNEFMIDKWASLLVGASRSSASVQPRLVSILSELGRSQVELLVLLCSLFLDASEYPLRDLADSSVDGRKDNLLYYLRDQIPKQIQPDDKELLSCIYGNIARPGIFVKFLAADEEPEIFEYFESYPDGIAPANIDRDISILASLGLVAEVDDVAFDIEWPDGAVRNFTSAWIYLTKLGFDFVSMCAPDVIANLHMAQQMRRPDPTPA
ncbi:MAG: hypothetical protein H5U22_20715 [Rhizobium sp.]|nr:hypothetical protein [Rhizobium sp.]